MIYFSDPTVTQISIQGTPEELATIYDKERLGNTSFAIQIKQEDIEDDPAKKELHDKDLDFLLNYL